MTRKELLSKPDYWTYQIQSELFSIIHDYLKKNDISQTDFGKTLGVTKGYISQVLNGNFDHKISKLVGLAMGTGKVPCITFKDLKKVIADDAKGISYKDTPQPTSWLTIDSNTFVNFTSTIRLTQKPRQYRGEAITTLVAGVLENDNSEIYY